MTISFRVFRRNNKNLILLWSQEALDTLQREDISAWLEGPDGERKLLQFSKFVPDNPEKFTPDVDGIVIPHASNGMDPSKPCTVAVGFGPEESQAVVARSILPANSTLDPSRVTSRDAGRKFYLYAMDYSKNEWVPLPHDGLKQGEATLLLKEEGPE